MFLEIAMAFMFVFSVAKMPVCLHACRCLTISEEPRNLEFAKLQAQLINKVSVNAPT